MGTSCKFLCLDILIETKQHDPKGSGKTEFLSRFINWYILNFVKCNGLTDLMIGVTAFTNTSILNLLKRIEDIQKQYGLEDLFSIIFATYDTNEDSESNIKYVKWRESLTVVNKLKKESGIRVFIMGATVYSWNNIKDNWRSFKGCRIMLIDEGSQLLVSDALLAIRCLSFPRCRLIVAGDHMVRCISFFFSYRHSHASSSNWVQFWQTTILN